MVSVYIHGIHTARGFKPPLSDSKFPRSPMGLTHGKEVVSPASPLTTRTPPPTGQARWETKYQEPRTCNKQRPVPYPQLPITDPRSPPAPRDPSAFSPQPRTAPCARKAVAPSRVTPARDLPHPFCTRLLPQGSPVGFICRLQMTTTRPSQGLVSRVWFRFQVSSLLHPFNPLHPCEPLPFPFPLLPIACPAVSSDRPFLSATASMRFNQRFPRQRTIP